jgi:hypothetical protein
MMFGLDPKIFWTIHFTVTLVIWIVAPILYGAFKSRGRLRDSETEGLFKIGFVFGGAFWELAIVGYAIYWVINLIIVQLNLLGRRLGAPKN